MLRFYEHNVYHRLEMHSIRSNARQVLQWLWNVVRLPILLPLVILEPIFAFLFGSLALLGLLTTAFFEMVTAPHFPTGTMLLVSISFAVALVLYESAIRYLSA